MNLTKENVALAVNAGLELLGPESEVSVPAKLNDGIFLLKQLLGGIASGQIALGPALQTDPNRKTRRTAAKKKRASKAPKKKTAKKKTAKKKTAKKK